MRLFASGGLPRLALLLSAVVLLLAGGLLGLRPKPAFAGRDAFVASLERGERRLPQERMAHEWRGDIAAQERLLREDRWFGGVLAGTGLLALVGVIAQAGRSPSSRAAA